MFQRRVGIATNVEIKHQSIIQPILLQGRRPKSNLELIASAITNGGRFLDVITQAKIQKYFDRLWPEMVEIAQRHAVKVAENGANITINSNECMDILRIPEVLTILRQRINELPIDVGDVFYLPSRTPIMAMQPRPQEPHVFAMNTVRSSMVSLSDFEYMVFGNRCRYRYLGGASFAMYLVQNILYCFQVEDVQALVNNRAWQARLALLIDAVNYNDWVSQEIFYVDVIRVRGIQYDTSFVPKYDVRSLVPQSPIHIPLDHHEMITYHDEVLDVRNSRRVDMRYIRMFYTFPFKDGHYIKASTGEIIYLDYPRVLNRPSTLSSKITIQSLCNTNDLETAIISASDYLQIEDVLQHTIYAKSIREQAIGLLLMRYMLGNVWEWQRYSIRIPSALRILSWTQFTCPRTLIGYDDRLQRQILLPYGYNIGISPDKIERYTRLVIDIAAYAGSRLNVALLCSSYSIPEYCLYSVYRRLRTDAEKYVFFTLILQTYMHSPYVSARDQLSPEFDTNNQRIMSLDEFLRKHPIHICRPYLDANVSDRLKALTQPLIKPTQINENFTPTLTPHKHVDMYEFTDPQLRELVRVGRVPLTRRQQANLLTLLLMRIPGPIPVASVMDM